MAKNSLPWVIIAPCVLYNICKAWGELFHAAWAKEVWQEETTWQLEHELWWQHQRQW